jgi:hypothetical protein
MTLFPLGVGVIPDLTEHHDLFPGPIADTIGGSKIAGNVGFSCCVCTIQWFGCRFGIPFAMVGNSENDSLGTYLGKRSFELTNTIYHALRVQQHTLR